MEEAVSKTGLGGGREMIKVKIRVAALLIGATSIIATGSWGQQPAQTSSVAALLEKLRSTEESERAKAFEELRGSPDNLQNPSVRAGLLDLLDRENHVLDSQLLEAQRKGYPDRGDNAAWGEYYSDLLSAVDSFADWKDPRQACILVGAASTDDSAFAAKISSHAKTTVPCLLQRCRDEASMNRAVACPVLVRALEKGKNSLGADVLQSGRQLALGALLDPDEGVRVFTVDAMGKFGGPEFVPTLKQIEASDPAFEESGGVKHFGVREHAAAAVALIEKRAAAGSDAKP